MKLWKAALSIGLLSMSLSALAGIGTITEQVNAPPSIQRQKSTLTGAKGTQMEMNDTVNTTKGKVGITFQDNTKVEVNENSKLLIDDFVYDPKNKDAGKLGMKVALGTVRYASGQIAHNDPSKVAINTPSATIGVRGTDFTMTVDESGESTIILLPSCPANKIIQDVKTECVTGKIVVYNDAGEVTLDKPFEGTKVATRNTPPMKPSILHLTADTINNLLIVSPPVELKPAQQKDSITRIAQVGDMLAVNYLQQNYLQDQFDKEGPVWTDPLTQPLLQQYFLQDIFDILSAQLQQEAAQLLSNMLSPQNTLLPDWFKASGVTTQIDPQQVTLCRTDGSSNTTCLTTPHDQNSTTYITQSDNVTIKNRINAGNNTIITVKQN
jgi:hypothetical protein